MLRESQNASDRGWLWCLFILLVVVVLPLEVSFGFLRQILEENSDFQKENLQIQLEKQAGSLAEAFNPNFVLTPFFSTFLIGRDSPNRLRFLRTLAKEYPGAFQIVMWNPFGQTFPVPRSLAFPPQVPLRYLMKYYLRLGRGAENAYTAATYTKGGDADLHQFQMYLGSSISLRDFFKSWEVPIEFQQNGDPALLFWGGPGTGDRYPTRDERFNVAGYFVQIDRSKLPKEFFVKMASRGFSLRIPNTLKTLAFLDTSQLKNSLIRKGLPRSIGFARQLKLCSEKKLSKTFMVDAFMATDVPTDAGPGKKVFLLMNASHIFHNEQSNLSRIRLVSRFLLFLAFGGLILIRLGWGRNLGLAWRIALLLIMAILLPLGGAFWAGKAVGKELEKQDYNRMFENLRFQTSMVSSRFPSFVTAFGIRLQHRLKGLTQGAKDEAEIVRKMDGISENSRASSLPSILISNYFLSDPHGKMSYTSMNRAREEQVVYKYMLQRLFQENIDSSNNSAGSLGDILVEDLTDMGAKDGNQGRAGLAMDALSKFKFARGETTILPIIVEIAGKRRVLLSQMGEGVMNQHFARYELSRGRMAKLQPKMKCYLYPFRDRFQNFAKSPIVDFPEITAGLNSQQETSGILSRKGREYLFFIADRSLMAEYRMLTIAPASSIKRASAERDNLLLIWFLFVLGIAFATGSILTKRILQPMQQLDFALGKIGEGDFSVQLPSMGEDEIGEVGRNVNHMVRELREKERMQAYLSDATLQAVRDGSAERDLEAQWKEVTILFSDIRGFTTLSEKHSPEALFSALNDFFETAESHIRNYGGQVQKFIGDAAYAVFPEEGRKGAFGAVAAAMEIVKFLPEFNRQREEKGLFTIAIGVGINTGRVLLGKVGSEARKYFAYIGDEVNMASALETASKQGKFTRIMVSEKTWKLVEDRFTAEKTAIPVENQAFPKKRIFEIRGPK